MQYRKARFKWHSSRDLDRATLEKGSRWKTNNGLRGLDGLDVVEATISEDEDTNDREEILTQRAIKWFSTNRTSLSTR